MTPDAALRRIVPTMGWHADRLKTIRFTGGADPVLPTPFCIGATASPSSSSLAKGP